MQVKKENTSGTQVSLTIIPTEAELTNMKQHVLGHFRGRVKVAGFREGKAPLELIEKQVDDALLQSEFLEEAINEFYVQTIRTEHLRPVGNPKVNITKFVPYTMLEFTAEIDVIGAVKLPDYKKLKKSAPAVTVTAEDVKELLENLRTRGAERKEVSRAAKMGDVATIDFKGADAKGEAIENTDGTDYPLTLGSGSFIPGFEDELVGTKQGEEKTFTVTFPADYHAQSLAKKKVTFTVQVKKVEELAKPKLDDAFAATVGPFKTLAELKSDVKKQLESEREAEAQRQFESELIAELAEKTTVDLPKALVDDQIERIEQQEKQNLVYRGQTWEEHLKEEGVTAEEHKEQKRTEAEKGLRASLLLAEVAEKEGLDVTPEELELRLNLLKGQYQDAKMQEELDKPENQRDIANRLLTEKTVAHLVGIATSK